MKSKLIRLTAFPVLPFTYKSNAPVLPLVAVKEWKRAERTPSDASGEYNPEVALVHAAEAGSSLLRQELLPVAGVFLQLLFGISRVSQPLIQVFSKLST